jgi:HAD superfamily hydrolase (TIGR01509 family)
MTEHLEIVFLDVGGPIYDDFWYGRALLKALRELGAEVAEADFWDELDRCRSAQAGMTGPLTRRFLGPDADSKAVAALAKEHWRYPPEALYADVLPTLEKLARTHRVGVLANQPEATRTALERDGIAPFIDVWVVSDEVGLAKPDPEIFAYAVRRAGCRPEQAVFVGNRLDNDIRPASATGLRTVWILRGEAPANPTDEQLAEPDAVIADLAELPAAIERLEVAA